MRAIGLGFALLMAAGHGMATTTAVRHDDAAGASVTSGTQAELTFSGAGNETAVPATISAAGASSAEMLTGEERDGIGLVTGAGGVHPGTETLARGSGRLQSVHGRSGQGISAQGISGQGISGEGMPDWEGLFLLGAGLCAGSGFCVYQASRIKRSGSLAKVIPIGGRLPA